MFSFVYTIILDLLNLHGVIKFKVVAEVIILYFGDFNIYKTQNYIKYLRMKQLKKYFMSI